METVLSASDIHKVVHHQAAVEPSETLVVTFAPKSDNFRTKGFGTALALSQGYDTIYVAQTRTAWHQGIDHDELAAQILPVAAGRKIVAYGASAGAYAALYFGGALNARILAIAPRNDIHPLITVSAEKTRAEFKHREHLDDVPKTEHAPVILFDPHQKKDARLANRWAAAAYPGAELHPIFGTGHNVVGGLHSAGALKPLALDFFQGISPKLVMIWGEGSRNWHITQAHFAEKRGDDAVALDHLLSALGYEKSLNLLLDIIRVATRLDMPEIAAAADQDLRKVKAERRRKPAPVA